MERASHRISAHARKRPSSIGVLEALRRAANFAVEALEQRVLLSYTVTTLDDNSSAGSLRYAITQADTAGGSQTIAFASTLTGSIDLASQLPDLAADVTIEGPGANLITIDASGEDTAAAFNVDSGSTSTVEGLTITGGIYAGVYNMGTLSLIDCTVEGNSGTFGGGICNGGILGVTGCTIADNSAVANGGGIFSDDYETVVNTTVTDNTVLTASDGGAGSGGGICDEGSGEFYDCTIVGNTAPTAGGGIQSLNGVYLDGSIVADNTGGDTNGYFVGSNDLIGAANGGDAITDSQEGTSGALLAPMLGPLQDNAGGSTPTMLPITGSPAIGNGAVFAAADGLDQNGATRPSTGVNIGAVQDFDGPTTISAVGDAGQVQLSWSAVDDATSYDIYRSSTSGGEGTTPYETGVTDTFFTDTGLAAGSSWYYTVDAVTPDGTSAPSAEASAITDPLPDAPTSLTAAADNGGVTLSWTPSPDALTYNIYRGTSSMDEGGTPISSGDEAAMFTDTTASPNTTYYYFVTGVSDAGEGSPSNETSILTVPAAPTLTTAAAGDTTITLAWPAVAGATSYNLYQGTGPGDEGSTPEQTGLTATSFTDTSLDDGTTYYYTLTAVNASGESLASAEVSATPVETAPTVATAAAASLSSDGTTVTLTTLGADAGGESNLTYSWAATAEPDGVDDPFFSDSDDNTAKDCTATLFGAGDYTFTVTITNNNQLTATSSVSLSVSQIESSVYVTAPSPTIAYNQTESFTAVALDQFGNTMPTQPDFTWAVSAGGVGGTVDSSGNYTAPAASVGYDTITATTDDSSAIVGSATIMTTPTGTAAPQDVYASPADGEIDLSWDEDPNAATYNIYRGTTSGGEGTTAYATSTTATFSDTGLTDGTAYYYTVTCVNTLGEGAASAEVSATPEAAPAAPSGLTAAEVSSNEIDLSWTDNSDNTAGFIVDRSDDGGSTFYDIATLAPSTTTYQDTSVSDGVSEVYEVAAFNTDAPAAESTFSSTATASTPLAAPDNFTAAAASTSEIDLSWIDESQVAQTDTILYSTDGSTYNTLTTIPTTESSNSFAVTGLGGGGGTTYYFQIQTNQTVGTTITTADSTTVTATTDLSTPDDLTVSTFNGISYDAPPSLTWSTESGATGYAIERTDNQPNDSNLAIIGGAGPGFGSTDNYQDDATVPGVTYNYEVVAYDDTDRSDPSTEATVTTSDINPGFLPYSEGTPINNTSAQIAWPINSGDAGMTYTIQRWGPSDSTWTTIASNLDPQTSSYIATGLTPGATYGFQVLASNDDGVTSMLVPGGVSMPNFQPPAPGSTYVSGITVSMALGSANADVSPSGTDDTGLYQPDYLYITRNGGDLDQPITVPFQITSDGVYGIDYALSEPSGAQSAGNAEVSLSGSGGEVAFQPGEATAIVELDPLNTGPRSGKEVTITAQSGSNYTLGTTVDENGYLVLLAYSATESLAPHGLAVELDQGEQYPIISSNTPGSLMPLNITLPDDLADGDTVTVSTTSSNVVMFTNNATGSSAAPVTTAGGAYVMTVGSSTNPLLPVLYAGAVGGSATIGDVVFSVAVGSIIATAKAATAVPPIAITSNLNPNNDPALNPVNGVNPPINGKTINWLVGQQAGLKATPQGPAAILAGHPYVFQISGPQPGTKANVLKTIAPQGQNKFTPVEYTSGSYVRVGNPQTAAATTFFWVSTLASAASEIDTVTVSLKGTNFSGSTKFQVFEPTAVTGGAAGQAGISVPGSPLAPPGLATGLFVNPQSPPEPPGKTWPIPPSSIYYSAQVTTPQPATGAQFNQGHFFFLQLVELQRAYYYDSPASDRFSQYPNQFILDVQYPFNKHSPYDPLDNQSTGWITGPATHYASDDPYMSVQTVKNLQYMVDTDSFETYVMYIPPGVNVFPVPNQTVELVL